VDCFVWPSDAQAYNVVFPPNACFQHADVAGKRGGKAHVFHEAAAYEPANPQLVTLNGALSRVLSYYARHLGQNLTVNVVLTDPGRQLSTGTNSSNAPAGISVISPDSSAGSPCFLAIAGRLMGLGLQHVVAHELYHCVQYQERPDRRNGTTLFEDGAANFFEYFLYASENPDGAFADGGAPHYYDPSTSLIEQDYQSSLFFMFRHNKGQTHQDLDAWIKKRSVYQSDAAERQLLASDAAFVKAFAAFACFFNNKKIYYDSPQLPRRPFLVTSEPVLEIVKEVNIGTVGDATEQVIDQMPSWTFRRYSITLFPGQTISARAVWTGTPAPAVVVWQRILRAGKKATAWTRFAPGIVHSGCGTAQKTVEFLVVPVAATETVTGRIRFVRENNAKCSCPTGGQGAKRRSLLGPALEERQQGNDTGPQTTGTWRPLPPPTQLAGGTSGLAPTPTNSEGFVTPTPDMPQDLPADDESDGPWTQPGDAEDVLDDDGQGAGGGDDDEDCHEAPVGGSCVLGRWAANKESMDRHMQDPYYRYTPSGMRRSSVSGTFTLDFSFNSGDGDSMVAALHEQLAEKQILTETSTGEVAWYLNSEFSTGVVALVEAQGSSFSSLGPEEGIITRTVAGQNITGSVALVPGSSRYQPMNFAYYEGMKGPPRGVYFSYNCTGSTLSLTTSESTVHSFVFDRV
jgi:hypothetical protein